MNIDRKKYLVTFTLHLDDGVEETGFIALQCHKNAKEVYEMFCAHGNVTDCYLSAIEDD